MTITHVDKRNRPAMVDVGSKPVTLRAASAHAFVRLPAEVLALIDGDEIRGKKGPVFATAIIAGTMAAKKTSELIPFCHPLGLESCTLDLSLEEGRGVRITCTVKVEGKTGVEMEALTGASVAALTIYDMCKGVSQAIEISEIRLLAKSGGAHEYRAEV